MLQKALRALASAAFLIGASLPAVADELPFEVGGEPPRSLGVDRDGQTVRLDDYPGQVRVVAFWASWCGPCLTELDALEEVKAQIPERDLAVLAVNIHEFDEAKARRIRSDYDGSGFVFSAERDREIVDEHHITTLPLLLMIDHNGNLRQVHEGSQEEKRDQIVDELDVLLAEQARDRGAEPELAAP